MWRKEETQFQPWKTRHSFQAKIYAVRACAIETIERSYGKGNMYIPCHTVQQRLKHVTVTRLGATDMGVGNIGS
jgi:hypothetical protein